jgi:hypothetical protein
LHATASTYADLNKLQIQRASTPKKQAAAICLKNRRQEQSQPGSVYPEKLERKTREKHGFN